MRLIGLLVCLAFSVTSFATGQDVTETTNPVRDAFEQFQALKNTVLPPRKSEHLATSLPQTTTLSGQNYTYKMVVHRTQIADRSNVFPPAEIVSFSYEAETDMDKLERPVIFAFNGGPGSASMWLHMGAWGPKRIDAPGSPQTYTHPPYDLVDNDGFLIDIADIVFIDPVGTGLSRPLDDGDTSVFFDTRVDARSICAFIRNWMRAEDRWGAPIYIAGESYGAIRGAGIAAHPTCSGVLGNLEGLIMVSGLLDLRARANNTPNAQIARFPTYAALGWYHKAVDQNEWDGDFDRFLDEAREAAIARLGPAALRGNSIAEEEIIAVRRDLGRFLGLKAIEIEARPKATLFSLFNLNMRDRLGGTPHFQDGRYLRKDRSGGSPLPPLDNRQMSKLFHGHLAAHTAALTGFEVSDDYLGFTDSFERSNWDYRFRKSIDWGRGTNLAEAITNQRRVRMRDRSAASGAEASTNRNRFDVPDYRILIASGLHDQNTPFFAMELALQQAGFAKERYDVNLYQGGHMMWLNSAVGLQLANDIRKFVNDREASELAKTIPEQALTP